MNQIELKCRASRLMTRMNALGFTKDGKPMVIDQAYELVAAEEGYRNQHILRTKLVSQATPVRQLLDTVLNTLTLTLSALETPDDLSADEKFHLITDAAAVLADVQESKEQAELDIRIPRTLTEDFATAIMLESKLADWEWAHAYDSWELVIATACKLQGIAVPEDLGDVEEAPKPLLEKQATIVKPDGRQLREQAEAAYENYDFGPGFTVCAANGWETIDAYTTLTRVVFLSDDANPNADSKRVVFIFDAHNGEVTTTHIE